MAKKTAPKKKAGEYANRSVLVGASLLRTISRLGGVTNLQQIAEASGMLPARTHRFLLSLVKSGLVDYDTVTGRYDLGALVLELGLTALGRLDAVRLGSNAVRALTERLDMVSMLSVWGSNGATIVKSEVARNNRINLIREGMNLPLLTSATGRIFFAYLPREETQDFLDQQRTFSSRNTVKAEPISAADMDALRADVRGRGIAMNNGTTRRDALAAPVFNYEGQLVMVMTIVSDAGSVDMSFESPAARDLLATVEGLSRQLGAKIVPSRVNAA